MPTWMELFERSGGTLEIRDVGREDLDQLAAESDLLIVAAGKGEISNLFERDAQRTEYTTPQRHLALAYMNGVAPHPTFEGNDFVKGDELGEMFMFPAITTTGPCHIVTLEAIPGGPLDVFDPTMNADEVLATVRTLAEKHFPALGERLAHATPSDPGGVLVGRFPPTRRAPVARLDNGRPILAAADVVALNDPLTGQGANNAARCADIYLDQIAARDDQPFDEAWMQATAGLFVDAIEASTQWTNSTLRPWPEHVRRLLAEAQHTSALAELFAEGFGDPAGVWAWWSDSAVADRLVGERSAPAAG
jgi:hypothetical protein